MATDDLDVTTGFNLKVRPEDYYTMIGPLTIRHNSLSLAPGYTATEAAEEFLDVLREAGWIKEPA